MFKKLFSKIKKNLNKKQNKTKHHTYKNKKKSKISRPHFKRTKTLENYKRPEDLPLDRASITNAYFQVNKGKRKVLFKEKDGIYYLGKAVYKNNVRKNISIKQYNNQLDSDLIKKYMQIINSLKNIYFKFNKKYYKNKTLNKHFPNLKFIKIQTSASPKGEWVLVRTSTKFRRFRLNKSIYNKFRKKKEQIIYLFVKLVENNLKPNFAIILEFLDIQNYETLHINNILLETNNTKQKSKILIKNIKKLCKILDSENENLSEYNKYLFDLINLSIDLTKNKDLKRSLKNHKNSIRFDKI